MVYERKTKWQQWSLCNYCLETIYFFVASFFKEQIQGHTLVCLLYLTWPLLCYKVFPCRVSRGKISNKNKLPECCRHGKISSAAHQNEFPVTISIVMKYCLLSSFRCVLAFMQTALKSRNNFIFYFESFKGVFLWKIWKWYIIDLDFAFSIMINLKMENLDTCIFWEMHYMYKMNGLGPQEIFKTVIIFSPYKGKKTCWLYYR